MKPILISLAATVVAFVAAIVGAVWLHQTYAPGTPLMEIFAYGNGLRLGGYFPLLVGVGLVLAIGFGLNDDASQRPRKLLAILAGVFAVLTLFGALCEVAISLILIAQTNTTNYAVVAAGHAGVLLCFAAGLAVSIVAQGFLLRPVKRIETD